MSLPSRGVVAEIGTSHNGNLSRALSLVHEATEAGADAVKFQAYTVDEILALRGDGPVPVPWDRYAGTMRELYTLARTPHHWFETLATTCDRLGVPWFASVFGAESIKLVTDLGVCALKVAATDVRDQRLIGLVVDAAEEHGLPIIASHPLDRCDWADYTLYCPRNYPQDWTGEVFWSHFDGISFHGTDLAVPLHLKKAGVGLVEVHVQLDDEPSVLDSHSSLTVSQLRELCSE